MFEFVVDVAVSLYRCSSEWSSFFENWVGGLDRESGFWNPSRESIELSIKGGLVN